MKNIDAEKLRAEIERRIDLICTTEGVVQRDRLQEYETLRDVEDFIDTLQQEQPKLYKDESLGSPDYERGFKHGRDYQVSVERKYTNKDKVIAYLVDKDYPVSTNGEIPTYQETFDMINNAIKYAKKQEQPEENNLPNKRTRVNYAICKLQSFKPLREAIVLDDYVYDEGKCYRENLLNYIHTIPENRLKEIRHYLQEKGWWPYDDDADWMEQEVDLEKVLSGFIGRYAHENSGEYPSAIDIARHFYELGLNARKEENK